MGNKLVWLQESYDMPIARYKCLMMATTTGQIGGSGSVCTRFPVPLNYPTHRIAPLHSSVHVIGYAHDYGHTTPLVSKSI